MSTSRRVHTTLVFALDLPLPRLERLLAQLAMMREMGGLFEPIVVTTSSDLRPFSAYGFTPEYVMTYDDWSKTSDPARYAAYLESRFAAIARLHRPLNLVIAPDLTSDDGRFDRNLYACAMRLGQEGQLGDALDPLEVLSDEMGLVNLNLARLERQVSRLAKRQDRPTRLARRMTGAVRKLVGGATPDAPSPKALRRKAAVAEDVARYTEGDDATPDSASDSEERM